MRFIAWDTETEKIADRAYLRQRSGHSDENTEGESSSEAGRGFVRTEPFTVPDVVLGSYYGDMSSFEGMPTCGCCGSVLSPEQLAEELCCWLRDPEVHLIGHSLTFDVAVMTKAFPDLRLLFDDAAQAGRLHDTKLLDVLYGLSVGRYDKPKYNPETKKWAAAEVRARSLDTIAQEYCGIRLDKDPTIRLTFGQFKGRSLSEIPEAWLTYARQDAVATYRVFVELTKRLEQDGRKNWLSEPIQVRAALALAALDERGVAIDDGLATKLAAKFRALQVPLQVVLAESELGRWAPVPKSAQVVPDFIFTPSDGEWHRQGEALYRTKLLKKGPKTERATPEFHLCTAAIQDALAATGVKDPPQRKDGTISMEYDFWAKEMPAAAPAALRKWLELSKVQKILSTYLDLYSRTRQVFPRWHIIGARSGRMAASGPSLQNVPKRKYGIRALFVPRPGQVFVKADYTAQEMYTLAEIMDGMGIRGPLYKALESRIDVHRAAGSIVFGKAPEAISKDERQSIKALNFGVPGGLGPKKLAEYATQTWGLDWTPEIAKEYRERYLNSFPDIQEYLQALKVSQDELLRRLTGQGRRAWAETLELESWNVVKAMQAHSDPEIQEVGIAAERSQKIELPTGRVRAACRFTEAANTGFQGLASDVTKEACWVAYRWNLRIVLVVHDEIVVECPPEAAEQTKDELTVAMLMAFEKVCPVVGGFAKVETTGPLNRWGPATDPDGKELVL